MGLRGRNLLTYGGPKRSGSRAALHAVRTGLVLVLVALVGLSNPAIANTTRAAGEVMRKAPEALQPYVVRLARPNTLVAATAPPAELTARDRKDRSGRVAAAVDQLVKAGTAGTYRFDDATETFHVALSDAARAELAKNPGVQSIEADAPVSAPPTPTARPSGKSIQSTTVSSVDYIQVYTPFMWGKVSIGGLSVTATLEDPYGNVIGVADQTFKAAPNNYIVIDRATLYFETLFEDPHTQAYVNIVPGDKVHVVTTGLDPNTNQQATDDRTETVDAIQAWTSYQNDTVRGVVPPNATVFVTLGGIDLNNYLTPGTNLKYDQVTADAGGNFTVSQFHTCDDLTACPLAKVDLVQGSSGFVRVRHSDLSEVYSVHGQNVFVLESSSVVHGYGFNLPFSPMGVLPNGLDSGVSQFHPGLTVNLTLKNSQGSVVDSTSTGGSLLMPYAAIFPVATIVGGDIVDVSVNGGPVNEIVAAPLSATIDLAGNQITGTGPANTKLTVGAGLIDGYIMANSYFTYFPASPTTDGAGHFSTGGVACGTSNTLLLQPGSFGYVGYEDSHGNFPYEDFAAPVHYVEANYPFVEGWIANGTANPTVTVRDSGGNLKSQSTVAPRLIYLLFQQVYVNTYYNLNTSQFIVPSDTVTVTSNGRTATIPVDNLTAYVNTDTSTIVGNAPAGATVRAIPAAGRSTYQTAVANGSNAYAVTNPYVQNYDWNCTTTTITQNYTPGAVGRSYLTHGDKNAVFVTWGRSMHLNENENFVEVFAYESENNDWDSIAPSAAITVTLTPTQGSPTAMTVAAGWGLNGDTKINIVDAHGTKQLIRAAGTLAVTFQEGPVGGPNRLVTLNLSAIPLILGTPDVPSNTIAGVGPADWTGQATISSPSTSAQPMPLGTRAYTAFGPSSFVDGSNKLVPLGTGYSGVVSFTNGTASRVWSSWASTALPVKITPIPKPGDTLVCGTAWAGAPINIHDVTTEPQDLIIGTGTADKTGKFCVTVNPPLYKSQVIMAEANGTYSQPVVIGNSSSVYLPAIMH